MDVKIKGVKTGTNVLVPVNVNEAGDIYVIICGLDGTTVRPVKVDSQGRIITVAGS